MGGHGRDGWRVKEGLTFGRERERERMRRVDGGGGV